MFCTLDVCPLADLGGVPGVPGPSYPLARVTPGKPSLSRMTWAQLTWGKLSPEMVESA